MYPIFITAATSPTTCHHFFASAFLFTYNHLNMFLGNISSEDLYRDHNSRALTTQSKSTEVIEIYLTSLGFE